MKGLILIIDDEETLRGALSRILELEGYRVFQAGDARKAYQLLDQQPEIHLVITDVRLPGEDGLQVLGKIKSHYPWCEVIVVTAFGTIQDGVQAMKMGAFDYVTKGDGDDQILITVERAVEKSRMQRRILDLEKKLKTRYSFEKILGKSREIKETILLAEKVAPADSTVLLEGETGTGKELFAQSIHNSSPRKNKPFIAVNCSAFPKELLESELFGYKKGAFTGAISDKKGLFEEANEGTLFLDEIGEMNYDLQAKLLRVLEDQTFTKIGDTKQVHVNVRILAATNLDLLKEAQSERFRPDLYYRLSVFKIRLPSLRERIEDIEEMALFFIRFYSMKANKQVTGMDPAFLARLKHYDWPGNTRELKNIIERTVILTDHEVLTADLLPYELLSPSRSTIAEEFEGSMEELEKIHIRKVLALAKGNKTKAADRLGIGIPTLYRKLKKYGLE
ncbi:MAG: sigma-54 dependent transcriptional regulator [Bacteroidetes bacterium]|nr:sigma-54 dependent transcriptional regulator [Bacteroidota bacterium]